TSVVEYKERRHVYNGDTPPALSESSVRTNRKVQTRKRSPLVMIMAVLGISLLIVLYVWNKIAVDRLVVDVNDLHMQYDKVVGANEILRAEINKKSSLERIGKIATDQLHLVSPKEQPVWFELDADRLKELQQHEFVRDEK
ncbi:MAG TPA: hypothetical protein VKI62_01345, partial [Bacteroidota bacterium]|nr:hypothetical protein [Bacteroidota bacterium]